jgi:serine/threonine-protein kinase RIO1
LKVTRKNIERMLVDLKTTRDARVARAKADIDTAIVKFQASLEDFRRKFATPSENK